MVLLLIKLCFLTEILPGTNAPPPTSTDEQPSSSGQDGDEALVQPDDSMALPSDGLQESSDESEEDVDVVQGEEEPSPEVEDGVAGKDAFLNES